MSPTVGANVSESLRKIINKRMTAEGFETDSEYLRWLIREDLKQAGLLGEKVNEQNQPEAAEQPARTG